MVIKDQKMFMVPEEILKKVCSALEGYIKSIDENCEYWGCMCDLRGEPCSHGISVILHDLESGSIRV